jgi:hypothetical protein
MVQAILPAIRQVIRLNLAKSTNVLKWDYGTLGAEGLRKR